MTRETMTQRILLTALLAGVISVGLSAQVSSDRLSNAANEPEN